jgi:hypothetical protein
VLRQLGVIDFEQGQLRQACFKRSAELQPDDANIQLKLGTLADAFDLWRVQGGGRAGGAPAPARAGPGPIDPRGNALRLLK